MKIKALEIKNFVGIDELQWNPSTGFNVLEGVKGSGKSSVLEGIEKAFSNVNRRTEVVRHGENEATLYISTDTGLEIDRRIRTDKADYLKLRQEGEGINSTEKELRKFINGDIFRPLDFINMQIDKQTAIILNMIEINWSMEDIQAWFGKEVLGINYDKHILQILKDIETKFYKEREEINRQVAQLKVQVDMIKKGLPDNYDGEEWREKNLQEYYNKITEAQKVNGFIDQAKALIDGFETKVAAINSDAESQKSKVNMKYKDLKQDCKDIIESSKVKIDKSKELIQGSDEAVKIQHQILDNQMEKEYQQLLEKYRVLKSDAEKCVNNDVNEQKDLIQLNETKIATKETELTSLDEKEEIEIGNIIIATTEKISNEKIRIENAEKYINENTIIDINPLQTQADELANMQSYLREFDKMQDIINGQLADKQKFSSELTTNIETARNKPSDLLKTHKLPIDGISVDENGNIRIDGILLDGLSEGEKFETAFKIALQRMGELKVICLDGFEKLNESEQIKVKQICEDNDIQAFVTITKDTESNDFVINGGKN